MAAIRQLTRLRMFKPAQQLVFAKGATGEKLRISGTDAWTGGVGSRSNDSVFGGEALAGNWEAATEGKGVGTVRSKQAIVFGSDGGRVLIRNTAQGQQDVDGTLEFEGTFKLNIAASTGIDARIGLIRTAADALTGDGVYLRRNEADGIDEWKCICENDGSTTTGNTIVIANNTYFRLKVELTGTTAKYWVNHVLIDTISNNLPLDEILRPTIFSEDGAETESISAKRIKFNFS